MIFRRFIKAILPPFLFSAARGLKKLCISSNGFSGPYKSFSEVTHDDIWSSNQWLELSKTKLVKTISNKVTKRDYKHLLIPLINNFAKKQKCELLDFGGGTGQAYFEIQSFLSNKNNITWNVVDDSYRLRDLGLKYAKNLNLKINFSKKIPNDKKFDIVFINTTLQYMPEFKVPFEELLVMPQYIVLTRLLVTNNEKVIMKQNIFGLYSASVFNKFSELISYFEGKGYTLIYNLPNFEEMKVLSNSLPKEFLSKYKNFSRDLILKKID